MEQSLKGNREIDALIWRGVKFFDHEPHWYTSRSQRLSIKDFINMDRGIEIHEAVWIPTAKK